MSAVVIDFNDVMPFRPPERYDLDRIVQRLRETAGDWVPRLFPRGRREGDEWRLANIRGDAPRKHGSCVIALKGAHAGDWIDFDGNDGGGPISAIGAATNLSDAELIRYAAEMTGIAAGKPRGSTAIGSFENWAHVLGGVLNVAGIEGFLGNLEEMMEASDSEGAAWSAFIGAWWDRFGTADVGAADLFDVAFRCDPAPPITGSNERAQRTSSGSPSIACGTGCSKSAAGR